MGNLIFLCDLWKNWSNVNVNVSVFSTFKNGKFYHKYPLLWHKNPASVDSNQVSITTPLFSILIQQNAKSKERPKALLKMFLIDVNRVRSWDVL